MVFLESSWVSAPRVTAMDPRFVWGLCDQPALRKVPKRIPPEYGTTDKPALHLKPKPKLSHRAPKVLAASPHTGARFCMQVKAPSAASLRVSTAPLLPVSIAHPTCLHSTVGTAGH